MREPRVPSFVAESFAPPAEVEPEELPAWDVSGLSQAELAALRRFLERRQAIDDVPRNLLASDLAARLRPSVGGVGARPPARALPRAGRRTAPHPHLVPAGPIAPGPRVGT